MSKEDVIEYVKFQKKQYSCWDFDDITGGVSNFFHKKDYNYLKTWYDSVWEEVSKNEKYLEL